MGCCSPNFREAVHEQEVKVNKKGSDHIPLAAKMAIVVITAGGWLAAYLL
ncbi:hypothetical protein DFO73_10566 [Cytobacillus oceanisediminis]|jgi:exonuclease III|uniref:Uncharacterized protein n=1 Tax=Cytobacillus oceanisediminis TaxID=665099 RepID=A0A2V2ZWN3_9BACI|nr:hypothetical protein [Cytobacillus oceanisediminis]PWW28830.1 hypothetical protein DFO73_10566 [Cytobacillus oceanisediminis]